MKYYIFGDIHGHVETLDELLVTLKEQCHKDDTIVFLGDYIDRGLHTPQVIDRLLEIGAVYPNSKFLRGNHEQMILDAKYSVDSVVKNDIDGYINVSPALGMWIQNGGRNVLLAYDCKILTPDWASSIPQEHWDFFESTLMDYTTDEYYFVHAGVPPKFYYETGPCGPVDGRLWVRDEFLYTNIDYGRLVVYGHTPNMKDYLPRVERYRVGMDTGSCFGGRLSMGVFPEHVERDNNELPIFELFQSLKEKAPTNRGFNVV